MPVAVPLGAPERVALTLPVTVWPVRVIVRFPPVSVFQESAASSSVTAAGRDRLGREDSNSPTSYG